MECKQYLFQADLYRFRWVECQLDTLRKCRRPRDVEKALNELPETLDETYNRILRNIPPQDRNDVFSIIQMLAVSYRPLTLDEVSEALSIDFESETVNREDVGLMDKYDILKICSSLVTLSERVLW
jgi:hypothetical protein